MDKDELERMKDELSNLKAEELKYITDPNEYAMRANEQRDFMKTQMQHDAIRTDEQSEERFRKMMQMGEEKQDIEHKNITQEIIKNNKKIEEIKKHR